jgi:hypothetical protein
MSRRTYAANQEPIAMSELETLKSEIEALENFDLELLRRRWRSQTGRPAPTHLSRGLMVRILAYRHQAARLGDIDRALQIALGEAVGNPRSQPRGAANSAFSASSSGSLRPGTVLAREHDGVMHKVMVMEKSYSWDGKQFRSLSEVARAITGTNWNGPRFFGLRTGKKADTQKDVGVVDAEAGS